MKKILVIEDEPEMRRNLLTILKLEGFQVCCAENGRAGIGLAQAERPDLVVCDVMMPELDGHAVLRELRKSPETQATPFIFLTARAEKKDQRSGMDLGADDYLTKPVSKDDLVRAVRARLQRAAQAAKKEFRASFDSAEPLVRLGLSPRVAEVLLWVAQGKSNADVGTILGISESTVKKHMLEVFQVLGVENRSAATLRALEALHGH